MKPHVKKFILFGLSLALAIASLGLLVFSTCLGWPTSVLLTVTTVASMIFLFVVGVPAYIQAVDEEMDYFVETRRGD